MIPWIYHRLTPRDQGTDLLRIMQEVFYGSGAASLVWNYTVPPERVLLLTAFNAFQFDVSLTGCQVGLQITKEGSALQEHIWTSDASRGTSATYHREGSPFLIVPPLHQMQFVFTGSSGVQTVTATMNGILIPHGTFSA